MVILTEPMRLLGMIHHRSHSDLADWVLFDREQITRSFHLGFFRTAYNPHAVVTYGTNLGQLVQWDVAANHAWDYIGYPCPLLIFEAQSVLSGFLRRIVDLIMQNGIENAISGCTAWTTLSAAGFKPVTGDVLVARSTYVEQPFNAPPSIDANYMFVSFESNLEAAYDEMACLQSDPLLFRTEISSPETSSVFRAMIACDKKSLPAPHMCDPIVYGVDRVEMWRDLTWNASQFLEIRSQHHGAVQVGTPLPKDYRAALMRLEAQLHCRFSKLSERLRDALPLLPAFRKHFRTTTVEGTTIQTAEEDAYREDKLFWCVYQLVTQQVGYKRAPSFLLDQIEQIMIKGSEREKRRLDQFLCHHISDMASLDEALSAVRLHRSKVCLPSAEAAYQICQTMDSWRTSNLPILAIRFSIDNQDIAEAFQVFQSLPLPTRWGNAEVLLQLRDLYEAAQAFWVAVSIHMRSEIQKIVHWPKEEIDRIMSPTRWHSHHDTAVS